MHAINHFSWPCLSASDGGTRSISTFFHTLKPSNTTQNDDEKSVLESQGQVNQDWGDWANRGYTIHWKDVFASAGDSNIVKKTKNPQFTKLVGVQDGDKIIPTENIMLDQFRKMGSNFKL